MINTNLYLVIYYVNKKKSLFIIKYITTDKRKAEQVCDKYNSKSVSKRHKVIEIKLEHLFGGNFAYA